MIYVCVKLYASKKTKYMPMFNFVKKKQKKKKQYDNLGVNNDVLTGII